MPQSELSVEVVNLKEVQEYIRTMPEESFPAAKTEFQRSVLKAHKTVQKNLVTKLKRRTGHLAKSMRTEVSGTNFDNLRASIYSASGSGAATVIYAPVHELGTKGVGIEPIDKYKGVPGGPYLNIPAKANLTPAGVMRKSARSVFSSGGYIRSIGGGRYGVFLGSQMMFFLSKGPIKIKARLGMRKAAEDEIPTLLSSLAEVIGEED